MPRLIEGDQVSGLLQAALAQRWGLPAGVRVAGGAGDNAASAIGVGAVRAGQGLVSLGTSGVVFRVSDAFRPCTDQAVHTFAHALGGRWHHMSVMLSAASALGWLRRLTGTDEVGLSRLAGRLSPAERAQAPMFLPYLSGERTPHNNPQASGVFLGLRSHHGPADLAWAVMEGVGFGLLDGLQAMGSVAGQSPAPFSLVGGGARSDVWAGLLASTLGCPLLRPAGAGAAAALGAARLAWLADGGDEATVCQPLPTQARFEPEPGLQALLQARHQRFRAAYPALQALF